jgi:hypothetical protein
MIAHPAPTRDEADWPALIAALQIRADHHADVIARLVEVIARLDLRVEALEARDDERRTGHP